MNRLFISFFGVWISCHLSPLAHHGLLFHQVDWDLRYMQHCKIYIMYACVQTKDCVKRVCIGNLWLLLSPSSFLFSLGNCVCLCSLSYRRCMCLCVKCMCVPVASPATIPVSLSQHVLPKHLETIMLKSTLAYWALQTLQHCRAASRLVEWRHTI